MATRNYRIHQTMQTFSLEELYRQITDVLPICGIVDCFIVKYNEPVTYPEQEHVPDQATLLFAQRDGQDILRRRSGLLQPTNCCRKYAVQRIAGLPGSSSRCFSRMNI